jgi:hypothetical protein
MDGSGNDAWHGWINVFKIYDCVLQSLQINQNRKYQMSEVCFIKPWYN